MGPETISMKLYTLYLTAMYTIRTINKSYSQNRETRNIIIIAMSYINIISGLEVLF